MSIKRNFIYSGFLTTANYIFPLLTYPYVSRVLGVQNFGLYNFIDSIINYFIMFSMMGVSIMGIREIAAARADRTERSEAFKGILVLNLVATLVAIMILILSTLLVPQLRENSEMMWLGCFKLFFNLFLIEWFFKGVEEFKYITIRSILVKTIYVLAVFVFVKKSDDYVVYYLLSVLMIAFNAVINIVYSRKFVSYKGIALKMRPYIRPFFVLGIYILSTSLYTTFNTAFLGFSAGDTQVGYYSTSTKLYSIFVALFTAYTGVMMPRMTSLLAEGKFNEFKSKFKLSVDILFSLSLPVLFTAEILAPQIILLISGPGYEGAITPMRIIMPLVLIIGYEQILVIQSLMPLQKDREITINSVIGGIIGIVLNFILVPHLKAIGSAMVWVSCEMVILILSSYCLNRVIHQGFPFKVLGKQILIYIPLLPLQCGVSCLTNNYILQLVSGGVLFLLYFLFVNIVVYPNGESGKQLCKLLKIHR